MTKQLEKSLNLRPMSDVLGPDHDPFEDNVEELEGGNEESEATDGGCGGEMVVSVPAGGGVAPPGAIVDIRDQDEVDYDNKLKDIYELAMSSHRELAAHVMEVEPKYAGKIADTAIAALRIAMDAVSEQNAQKMGRKKLTLSAIQKAGGDILEGKATVVGDRNEMLRAMRERRKKENGEG